MSSLQDAVKDYLALRRSLGYQLYGHELLQAGGSLPEVAQVLRHRQLATTTIYAKVDRHRLRELARPWPHGDRS